MQKKYLRGQQNLSDYTGNKEEVKRQTVIEYLQEMRLKTNVTLNEKEKVLPLTKVTEPIHENE